MIFTTVAYAQQDKGSWYIGASSTSLGFDSKTNTENTGNTEIIYMRYDDDNLKYIYICPTCDYYWTS